MERKILSSFIVINLVLCLLAGFPVQAQNSNRPPASNPPKEQKKEVDEEAFPLYNGVTVSVDLWGIGSKAFGSDFLSSEVAVDVNLKNRFFPIVELGYGGTDAWNDNGTHYKSNAPYLPNPGTYQGSPYSPVDELVRNLKALLQPCIPSTASTILYSEAKMLRRNKRRKGVYEITNR